MKKLTIKAPAKLNLSLDILFKREDGYHEMNSVMVPITLHDIITIEKTDDYKISIDCTDKNIPTDDKNICWKITEEFFNYVNINFKGIKISIEKNIPEKAGMAGGSTDAASTLILLDRLYNTNLSLEQKEDIGEKVGSDVPFCIRKKPAFASGRGETLHTIETKINPFFLIVKPVVSSSTKNAYENFSERRIIKRPDNEKLILAIKNNDITGMAEKLCNIFEEIIDGKEIELIKNMLYENGAIGACMTGSGTAVYGVFSDEKLAVKAYKFIKNKYNSVYLENIYYDNNNL